MAPPPKNKNEKLKVLLRESSNDLFFYFFQFFSFFPYYLAKKIYFLRCFIDLFDILK